MSKKAFHCASSPHPNPHAVTSRCQGGTRITRRRTTSSRQTARRAYDVVYYFTGKKLNALEAKQRALGVAVIRFVHKAITAS